MTTTQKAYRKDVEHFNEMAVDKKYRNVAVGKNLRRMRLLRKMSIDEISNFLDLTPSFVGLIERGERGLTTSNIIKLSILFDEPIEALFNQFNDKRESVNEEDTLRNKINWACSKIDEDGLALIYNIIATYQNSNRKRLKAIKEND